MDPMLGDAWLPVQFCNAGAPVSPTGGTSFLKGTGWWIVDGRHPPLMFGLLLVPHGTILNTLSTLVLCLGIPSSESECSGAGLYPTRL